MGGYFVAFLLLLLAAATVWWSLQMRKRNVSAWWAYLISVPVIVYMAIVTALGHPPPGRG